MRKTAEQIAVTVLSRLRMKSAETEPYPPSTLAGLMYSGKQQKYPRKETELNAGVSVTEAPTDR